MDDEGTDLMGKRLGEEAMAAARRSRAALNTELTAEYRRVLAPFRDPSKRIQGRSFVLYQLALGISHLDGDTVECGVGNGKGSHLIRAATSNPNRHHHIFDSFEGLSKIEPEDHTDYREWRRGEVAYQMSRVESSLMNYSAFAYGIVIYKGWIPDRFHKVKDMRFIFVHVDVDLYQPTKDSIRFFFPRLLPGGLLVCDDYGSARCPGARKAMDDYASEVGIRVTQLATAQGCLFAKPGLSP